ncbi:MAG TPA: hypothetical protein PLB81_12400, partial [Deltaproteobacteria bacterium]|nr:hypothetical protein [Deltaproteobacteria bacterium]
VVFKHGVVFVRLIQSHPQLGTASTDPCDKDAQGFHLFPVLEEILDHFRCLCAYLNHLSFSPLREFDAVHTLSVIL